MKIFALYSLFAFISMVTNISIQPIFLLFYQGMYAIELSIFIGTIIGLPIRFILEKKYIYKISRRCYKSSFGTFSLYGSSAVFTTLIFWGFEYTFHLLFEGDIMRYIGGIIGLTIGFVVKYRLDKKYVFGSNKMETFT